MTKVTGEEREMVLAEYKPKRQKLMTIPCTAQTDKKLKYVRYADYTEVETMPKLFIKANSLKRFQISFSA